MYLHVFHPVKEWDTRNYAIVSDKPDRIDDWLLTRLHEEWKYPSYDAIQYDVYRIEAGMELRAEGYDAAELIVNQAECIERITLRQNKV